METTKHVTELLPDFLQGSFDEADRSAIQTHLQSCPDCRQEYESLSSLWNTVGTLPELKPGPHMRERFNAMLAAYEQGLQHGLSRPSVLSVVDSVLAKVWPRRPAFQVGIAFLMLVIGGIAGTKMIPPTVPGTEASPGPQIAQLEGEVQTIKGMLAVSLMQQQSASERLKGVSMSSRIAEKDPRVTQSLLDALRFDPSVNVRLAALDALAGEMDESNVRKTLVSTLPSQSSPLVQLAMVELVVESHDRGALEVLNKMKNDPKVNDVVRKKVQQGIQLLM
ncbi:MAG TPA: zf-HC2 domain-containing protein [Bacteroidota bacterium]|nr:zf-HC2 domain-containing protein [Bacteroidota bacterium]